jgi:hypothetical protein
MKNKFEPGKMDIRRTERFPMPYGESVRNYTDSLKLFAEEKQIDLDKIYIDFDYEMGYYNNPDLFVELQWMSPETDKEYNKRIETEKKKNLLDAENKRKSLLAEQALYLKLKKKYE